MNTLNMEEVIKEDIKINKKEPIIMYSLLVVLLIILIYISFILVKTNQNLSSENNLVFPQSMETNSQSLISNSGNLSGENKEILNPIQKQIYEIDTSKVIPLLPHTVLYKTSDGLPYSGEINISSTNQYNQVQGVSTFRGNNYRDTAFYGELEITENKLSKVWTNTIGQTDNWTGIGWNGQPAIIKWDKQVQNQMNLYDEFKNKEGFIEVIYGGLDSTIHFYDLETGTPSRPVITVPSSIKGSVTIDPRGYPLLYVGQGINAVSGESVKMGYHIFSLIDGTELLFINGRDSYAYLGWGAFDGNPIIDANSDTMVLPGENGLIYIVKLNTNYDTKNGTISLTPKITRLKVATNGYAGGIENSIAVYSHYAYHMNNNGIIQCIDLNDLSVVWNNNMGDDCDSTIGLEEENNKLVLYAGSEVDRQGTTAPAYARKFDAFTGEVLWEYSCNCKYDSNVNGGVLSSPIIGKNSISNMVIFNFSKVTTTMNGKMVALNKENGEVIWEKDMPYYSWSSPVAVYVKNGDAYIIFGNAHGQVLLIDAKTGNTLYTLNTGGGNIEGSPAIYDNKIIIGTRGKRIYCIEIK